MKRFILATLFLSFFGFTHSAFAYDPPYPLPYTYNGITYDYYFEYKLPSYGFGQIYYYTGSCGSPYEYPRNPLYRYGEASICGNAFIVCTYYNDNPCGSWTESSGSFGMSTLVEGTSNTHSSKDIVSVYDDCGIDNANNCSVWMTADVASAPATLQLNINRSPEAGGGVSDYPTGENILCGIDSYEVCEASFPLNTEVTLDASPNEGYEFSHWEINDLAMADVDGSIDVVMSEDKNVVAVFVPVLNFPLSGTLENRELSHFFFGDTWTYGECPTGVYKKHVGVDLSATVDEEVQAAHAGTVRDIFTGQHSQWADAIVVENADGQFTTVYWHVIKYDSLTIGDPVTKGQQIATIANLGGNTHFHFGFRWGSYDSNLSLAGALPEESCGTSPLYPAFPENFVNPNQLIFE